MSSAFPSAKLSFSERIYRALLLAYPRNFRDEYALHMTQIFRDMCRDTQARQGTWGILQLWPRILCDLVISASTERLSERSMDMFSPKLAFWGGLAGAIGGATWIGAGFPQANGTVPIALALLLTLGGLAALRARHGQRAGWLAWTGLLLGVAGTGLALAVLLRSLGLFSGIDGDFERNAAPLALQFSLALGTLGIGYVLIGLATLRTRALPRWRALPAALGVLHLALGIFMWSGFYVPFSHGLIPWENPATDQVLSIGFPLIVIPLGALWLALGAMLAGDRWWGQISQPSST